MCTHKFSCCEPSPNWFFRSNTCGTYAQIRLDGNRCKLQWPRWHPFLCLVLCSCQGAKAGLRRAFLFCDSWTSRSEFICNITSTNIMLCIRYKLWEITKTQDIAASNLGRFRQLGKLGPTQKQTDQSLRSVLKVATTMTMERPALFVLWLDDWGRRERWPSLEWFRETNIVVRFSLPSSTEVRSIDRAPCASSTEQSVSIFIVSMLVEKFWKACHAGVPFNISIIFHWFRVQLN